MERGRIVVNIQRTAATLFCVLMFPLVISAHPHIWIDSDFYLVDIPGKGAAVRVLWYFDELYSSGFLADFDHDSSRTFSAQEIREIRENAFSHLINNDYYTRIFVNNRSVPILPAEDFTVVFADDRTVYSFSLPLQRSPGISDRITVTSYDETFFIDFLAINPAAGQRPPAGTMPGGPFQTRSLVSRNMSGYNIDAVEITLN
jgi:ABC-type uncharacterized transport system substrate-binding protein